MSGQKTAAGQRGTMKRHRFLGSLERLLKALAARETGGHMYKSE